MGQINGYEYIYNPSHHRANKSGCVYEHILVAEQILNRPLKDEEVVHHKDGVRSNNDPDNLIIFKTKSDHTCFHHDKTAVKDIDGTYYCINNQHGGSKKICPFCNNEMDHNAKMCKQCWSKENNKMPDRDILKQLIRTMPFTQVGRQYGVTDNAIRKWCDRYNLPRKVYEIRKYTDAEWENI